MNTDKIVEAAKDFGIGLAVDLGFSGLIGGVYLLGKSSVRIPKPSDLDGMYRASMVDFQQPMPNECLPALDRLEKAMIVIKENLQDETPMDDILNFVDMVLDSAGIVVGEVKG